MGDRAQALTALGRNKRSIGLNLKDEAARRVFYRLAEKADVVLEGFRPGVVKRLGVDYETVSARNQRIVYCSLSGYGQTGPYAQLVGHDINYISIGGALGMIGWPDTPPAIPMNIIADFAAGGPPPLYNVYECQDGGWISIGSLEPHFWANLCRVIEREDFIPHEFDSAKWPEIFDHFRARFKTKTRDEWVEILKQTDICAAPVYGLDEALNAPHNLARGMVVEVE